MHHTKMENVTNDGRCLSKLELMRNTDGGNTGATRTQDADTQNANIKQPKSPKAGTHEHEHDEKLTKPKAED